MKKALLILLAGVTALVLALAVFVLTFDINPYKPRIEAAASRATGMDVRINGKMRLTLSPRAGVSLEDMLIRNRGADIVSVKKAAVEIMLLPLLRREVMIDRVVVVNPSLFITRDRKGRFNFETPEKKPAPRERPARFKMESIAVKGGHVQYLDERSGGKAEADGCGLAVKDLSGGGVDFLSSLSFDGVLSCDEVNAKGLRVSDIRVVMKAAGGKFEADPLTMKVFGGDGRGSIKGAVTGKGPEFSAGLTISKFRVEEMLGAFKQKKTMRGELDLSLRLAVKGGNAEEMTRTSQGEVSLRGHDLVFEGFDLDRVLEKYEKSQQINLADVGAFFVAGPLGALFAKGYDFGSIYKESLGGKSAIRRLVSDWKVEKGVAGAKDVAFTTNKNRIALKGKLDFVGDRFEGVTVAVLNANSCAVYSQKIEGPFKKPRIDKPNIVMRSLMGPIISLAKKPFEMLEGGRCEVFYSGSLDQP
ncbi:MAG: AsmA family protein [Deltaproteobacteria bacterium]|nr:AsmA family protein [Deltaproteobacteria bacterium]